MSGSSLDGLDIAYCRIETGEEYFFQILFAETVSYPEELKSLLNNTTQHSTNWQEADNVFGNFCGDAVQSFIQKYQIHIIDFIASHGHTIAHAPEKKFSLQIGNAALISQKTSLPVIYDFRNADIQAGGQGAPLVPICDALLFPHYNVCLNIGGIANISFDVNAQHIGYDICAANQLLNHIAHQLNKPFDMNGEIAASGKVNAELLLLLNSDTYFAKPYPKSLDNGYVRNKFIHLLDTNKLSPADKCATAAEHIAIQIADNISKINRTHSEIHLLITGGGAFNKYLINRITALTGMHITLPDDTTIQYKEALAMALMGVLRMQDRPNFIPSVTGARFAVCGGKIYLPKNG